MQIFSGQISTACGTGSSEMGPFYFPGDEVVYLDTQFTEKLLAMPASSSPTPWTILTGPSSQ